jgi:hypothetical protein
MMSLSLQGGQKPFSYLDRSRLLKVFYACHARAV